ncbi:hypothetical protein [Streptomyces sp. NPDC050560]|uniref:SCO2583 family membrane protein n=1 Tax=Streptomyces sp. NPDC050560 TaxID=3365630 RepID=UPI0037AA22CE
MGGQGHPPDGSHDGAPGGSEDEYRGVVFDESFIRAAHLQESSARERVTDHAPAVRRRLTAHRRLSRQAIVLVLLMAVAFGTAVYMGVTRPGTPAAPPRPRALHMTVIPLAPQHPVPGEAHAAELFAHSPAAHFKTGGAGITLPTTWHAEHFSDGQVMTALTTAKDYLVESSLDPDVLTKGSVRPVRILVDPDQLPQFDRSFKHPAADGKHAPIGWLIRFDPTTTALADAHARTRGTLTAAETGPNTLQVTSDHTFVYALKAAGTAAHPQVSLFTVRRELVFRFDRADLRLHQAELLSAQVQAGPMSCPVGSADTFRPLLAGEKATPGGPNTGTDPYATGAAAELCGTLATKAEPTAASAQHG